MSDGWHKVAELELNLDLSSLAQFLRQQNVPHRITEAQGQQIIWVQQAEAVAPLQELLQKLSNNEVQLNVAESVPQQESGSASALSSIQYSPATFILCLLSVLGFAVIKLQWLEVSRWLVFLHSQGDYLISFSHPLENGQLWRLFTPAFLHFGIFHIVFNGLWLWDLGRRLERLQGVAVYLLCVLLIALVSNLSQFWWANGASFSDITVAATARFGGMSGVIYGLLGYIAVRQQLAPSPLISVPKGIIIFMFAWLFICMSGVVELVMSTGIANAAHVGGLVAGIILGLVASLRARAHQQN